MALPRWLRASDFEFRYRSPLNLAHFAIAYFAYYFDDINIVQGMVWWVADGNESRARTISHLIFAFGALLVGLAAAIRTWASAYIRSSVVHDRDMHVTRLVADGPYRWVRNPLYLGTFLLTIGIGFLMSRLGFAILVIGGIIRILRLIGREEAEFESQQGDTFREFCRRVPRLIPALSPRVPAGGIEPNWDQAFWGEAFMWGFFLAMVVFAVTLQTRITWTVMGLALAIWFLQNILRLGRRPA